MVLSTENDVLQNLSFDKTLEIFATQKARKKLLLKQYLILFVNMY